MISAVYVAPDANASSARGHLHNTVRSHQSMYPEVAHFAEDFDHADLSVVLPIFFYQHKNVLPKEDKVHSNIKLGFTSTSGPVIPNVSALIPAYTLSRKVLLPHPDC